jgi:uncharacterized OB-fold protein
MDWGDRPLPVVSPETQPFWDACREGKFLIQRCRDCGRYQYHYRGFCCHCWSSAVEDVPLEGTGTVWTFSVVHRNRTPQFAGLVPYVVALVEVEHGLKIVANVVNCDPESVEIGMTVRLVFVDAGEFRVPMFEPA